MRAIDSIGLKQALAVSAILEDKKTIEQIIDEQPTIEPQRKNGMWINIRHDNIAECDQCGITGRAWMNFCFDCGADMRGEE